jgi:hypothetical protein
MVSNGVVPGVQGVMYLLLLSMSAHLTKELGMAPGGEFRRFVLSGFFLIEKNNWSLRRFLHLR